MNIVDIILIVVLVLLIGTSLFFSIRRGKRGGCGCGCANCTKKCASDKKA